jgi:hypothetical protein
MSNFHKFLVEHAMFPFPETVPLNSSSTDTSVSELEAGIIKKGWKAEHAVRDDALVQKLCDILQEILVDMVLPPGAEDHLLSCFSPKLGVTYSGRVHRDWLKNQIEADVSFPNDFFMAEQFEQALTLRTESVLVRPGFFRRR